MNYFHIVRKRLITLGVKSRDARAIALDLDRQVRSRGLTSALSYFKDTGDTLIGYLSGSKYKAPWVATKSGYPTHWLRLKSYPIEVQLRVAKLARVILLDKPTPAMVKKLKDSACEPFSGTQAALDTLSAYQKAGLEYWKLRIGPFRWTFGTVAKASRTYVSRSVPSGTEVGLDLEKVAQCYYAYSGLIHRLPFWQDALYPVHTSWLNSTKSPFKGVNADVGVLGGVMENGGKLRIFAAPNVLLQTYLEPLQVWLDSLRDQVTTDCYRHQESGALWAQTKMKAGIQVQSIDLSSATCRYPFSTQVELCELLGVPTEMLDLYKAVSRGRWKVASNMVPYFGDYIRWSVGQPLGVNPSMSSFALSHNLVLTGMCLELGLDPTDSFRVLGDDVVCASHALSSLYRQVVGSCGITISEHKSYNSYEYAEFAGYSITPTVMVRPGRWRKPSVLNIQGLVKELGAQVIDELENQLDHRIEKIISFRLGTFNPEVEEWSEYLMLNTTFFGDDSPTQVSLREKEVEWYDGITYHLRGLYPGIFFNPPTKNSLVSRVLNRFPELKDGFMGCVGPYDPDTWSPSRIALCFESIAKLQMDYSSLVSFIRVLKEEYEAHLWSIPKTEGRKARDLRSKVLTKFYEFGLNP